MIHVKPPGNHIQRSSFLGKAAKCLPRPNKQVSTRRRSPCTAAMALFTNPVVLGTSAIVLTAVATAIIDARRRSRVPKLQVQLNEFNRAVLSRCPSINTLYRMVPFLTNGHVETILCSRLRRGPVLDPYKRRIMRMPDGGSVALDFEDLDSSQDLPSDAPVVILLPGLTGGSHDSYVKHMVLSCRSSGLRAIVFNSRGTSDGPVTSPQFYSASYTGDMRAVVKEVQGIYPDSVLMAAGWSLGANILVRYLGEEGEKTPIRAAISMCNPFNLTACDENCKLGFNRVTCDENFKLGFNRVYDKNLANGLRRIYKSHEHLFKALEDKGNYQLQLAANSKTIRDFDDAITRVSFGWPSVDAYYAGSSSSLSIPNVAVPLLCVQAEDDPIAVEPAIPYEALAQNPNCTLVTTPGGGHLGWAAGNEGPFGGPWTDGVTTEWLNSVLLEMYRQGRLPAKRAQPGTPARVSGRQGASRPEEESSNGAARDLTAAR